VLYLLHGIGDHYDTWVKNTNLVEYARPYPLIIVMPSGDKAWYVNGTGPNSRWEDYIMKEVMPYVDSHYRTLQQLGMRATAGLSMGGYGALKEGLKQPQRFAVVGAFSATANAARRVRLDVKTPAIAFGAADSATRKENDVMLLVGRSEPKSLPYIFVMTGFDDPVALEDSRAFVNVAQLMRVQYEYHELPGSHDWAFWQKSLEAFLRVLSPRIK